MPKGGTMNKTEKKNIRAEAIEELKRIKDLNELRGQEKEETDEYYNLNREPLSVDTRIEKTILLSWGGPSDGFKLYFDEAKELVQACYWVAEWGTYDETWLNDEEAQEVYDFYLGGYIE